MASKALLLLHPDARHAGVAVVGEVHLVIERLFRAYLDGRQEGERIQQFFTRHSDEELTVLGMGQEAAAEAVAAEA